MLRLVCLAALAATVAAVWLTAPVAVAAAVTALLGGQYSWARLRDGTRRDQVAQADRRRSAAEAELRQVAERARAELRAASERAEAAERVRRVTVRELGALAHRLAEPLQAEEAEAAAARAGAATAPRRRRA